MARDKSDSFEKLADKIFPPLLGETTYRPKEPIYHGTPPTNWDPPGATEIGPAWIGKTHN